MYVKEEETDWYDITYTTKTYPVTTESFWGKTESSLTHFMPLASF